MILTSFGEPSHFSPFLLLSIFFVCVFCDPLFVCFFVCCEQRSVNVDKENDCPLWPPSNFPLFVLRQTPDQTQDCVYPSNHLFIFVCLLVCFLSLFVCLFLLRRDQIPNCVPFLPSNHLFAKSWFVLFVFYFDLIIFVLCWCDKQSDQQR